MYMNDHVKTQTLYILFYAPSVLIDNLALSSIKKKCYNQYYIQYKHKHIFNLSIHGTFDAFIFAFMLIKTNGRQHKDLKIRDHQFKERKHILNIL